MIDRAVFARAAKAGIYGLQIDERFGGAGEHDYRHRMVAEIGDRPLSAAARRLRVYD
ncbi:hypothetical protein [Mycobacterium sp.]